MAMKWRNGSRAAKKTTTTLMTQPSATIFRSRPHECFNSAPTSTLWVGLSVSLVSYAGSVLCDGSVNISIVAWVIPCNLAPIGA